MDLLAGCLSIYQWVIGSDWTHDQEHFSNIRIFVLLCKCKCKWRNWKRKNSVFFYTLFSFFISMKELTTLTRGTCRVKKILVTLKKRKRSEKVLSFSMRLQNNFISGWSKVKGKKAFFQKRTLKWFIQQGTNNFRCCTQFNQCNEGKKVKKAKKKKKLKTTINLLLWVFWKSYSVGYVCWLPEKLSGFRRIRFWISVANSDEAKP